jgi:hypothetical protein
MSGNNDDHIRGNDTLMEIAPRMEMSGLPNDLLPELAVVHVHYRLHEHDGGRTS